MTYLCIPSKRVPAETERIFTLWRQQGYKLAIWRDPDDPPVDCDILIQQPYPGYAKAVNALCSAAIAMGAEWMVAGGDDTEPDQSHTADEIAAQCTEHFGGTFGIMQPTGDGHSIETICGSPWVGRDWCCRAYLGKGPLCGIYVHCFVDNDLQEVAKRLGVLWQRPDLRHKHNNWMWTTGIKPMFLNDAYSQAHWDIYMRIYQDRKRLGFPGSEPLPVAV